MKSQSNFAYKNAGSRIAFINDYCIDDAEIEKAKSKYFPLQHLWGLQSYLLKDKSTVIRAQWKKWKPRSNKFADSILSKINRIFNQLKFLLATRNSKIIYVAQSRMVDAIAFLCWVGISNKKIIMVVHHPGTRIFFVNAYYKIICISETVQKSYKRLYPKYSDKFDYHFWGPDLEWYPLKPNISGDVVFASNGKSHRDHELLIQVSIAMRVKCLLIGETQKTTEQYASYNNIEFVHGSELNGLASPRENINAVLLSSVMVIPLKYGLNQLCGLTSFLDAIALGMPIIMSKNTMIGIDIEAEGLGYFYDEGDFKSLEEKMKIFVDNPEKVRSLGENSRRFAERNNNRDYCNYIETLIVQAKNEK